MLRDVFMLLFSGLLFFASTQQAVSAIIKNQNWQNEPMFFTDTPACRRWPRNDQLKEACYLFQELKSRHIDTCIVYIYYSYASGATQTTIIWRERGKIKSYDGNSYNRKSNWKWKWSKNQFHDFTIFDSFSSKIYDTLPNNPGCQMFMSHPTSAYLYCEIGNNRFELFHQGLPFRPFFSRLMSYIDAYQRKQSRNGSRQEHQRR